MCWTRKCAAKFDPPVSSHRKRALSLLFPAALTLWLALMLTQRGTALSAPEARPATPTPDRLAKPPLPEQPTQADYGAQEYWFQCLPCHGDRGQGLTDEFRLLYPPEEQNCWESGCHGLRFYENGWTIPRYVPALIGPGALQKFPNALVLQAYIKASMPFQWPGTLDDETAWKLTAFLMRENGWWDGAQPLTAENALQAVIPSHLPEATGVVTAASAPQTEARPSPASSSTPWFCASGMLLLAAGSFWFLARWRREGQ